MERLTHEADFGLEDWEETLFFVKSDPNGAYNILDIAKYQGYNEFDEILKIIALRLASIENILGDDYDLDRLRELVEADRDGRCVVLPCKVGESLWIHDKDGKPREMILDEPDIRCHCKEEDNLCMVLCRAKHTGVCAMRLRNDGSSIGKTVFLTREEAEAALRRGRND